MRTEVDSLFEIREASACLDTREKIIVPEHVRSKMQAELKQLDGMHRQEHGMLKLSNDTENVSFFGSVCVEPSLDVHDISTYTVYRNSDIEERTMMSVNNQTPVLKASFHEIRHHVDKQLCTVRRMHAF